MRLEDIVEGDYVLDIHVHELRTMSDTGDLIRSLGSWLETKARDLRARGGCRYKDVRTQEERRQLLNVVKFLCDLDPETAHDFIVDVIGDKFMYLLWHTTRSEEGKQVAKRLYARVSSVDIERRYGRVREADEKWKKNSGGDRAMISMFTVPIRYDANVFNLVQVAELVTRMQLVVTLVEGQPEIGVVVTPEAKKRGRKHDAR